jgi:hypothetical protein
MEQLFKRFGDLEIVAARSSSQRILTFWSENGKFTIGS